LANALAYALALVGVEMTGDGLASFRFDFDGRHFRVHLFEYMEIKINRKIMVQPAKQIGE
jgi:hypothetical protein